MLFSGFFAVGVFRASLWQIQEYGYRPKMVATPACKGSHSPGGYHPPAVTMMSSRPSFLFLDYLVYEGPRPAARDDNTEDMDIVLTALRLLRQGLEERSHVNVESAVGHSR